MASAVITTDSVPTIDSHALVHTLWAMSYGPSAFSQMVDAVSLLCQMEVQDTFESIQTLDAEVVSHNVEVAQKHYLIHRQ